MRRQLAAALLGAALLTGGAQAVAEPTAARYVADEADVLSSETEQYIIDKNQSLFEDTGGEIVVVSVDFMDGMDAADYAMAVAESWGGIGDESLNNGFLLVYAVGENKVWAMAGSGIEDALPASKIEGWLEADFYGGYDAGEYDSATRAFFDDVYGWYESYYGTSAGTVVPSEPGRDFVYYPEPENDFVFAVVGQMGLFLLILLVVVVVCAADGWRYRMIYLEPDRLEAITGVRDWWFSEVVREDPLRSRQIGQLIYGLWHSDDPLAQQGMLLDLIDTFRPLAHHASAQGEAGHRFDRVRDYLHDNYMRPITLDELAQVAALSPYHFQRQFKAHYHVTPHQMLMAIRLWRAKAFLTHGMPAAEVAIAVGLTDQSHLTRAFTQRYGITPVRYQKQVARR